jgi:hypothetical protein
VLSYRANLLSTAWPEASGALTAKVAFDAFRSGAEKSGEE